MKTLRLFGLLMLLIAAGFSACKKDKSQATGIIGKWVSQQPYAGAKLYQDIYLFNADSSFSQTRLLADSVSGQPVAYQYYSTGKFHLNGDKLQLYALSIKYNNNYGTFEQLTQVQQITGTMDYTLALDADAKGFHFIYPPCPINALCVGVVSYYRK